jgi:glycine/D-amino acid oxidase-like deaminating enzyme
LLGDFAVYFGPYKCKITHEWTGAVGFTEDQYPIVGLMDEKRQYIIAGMAGSGSAVSFNAARCICNRILGKCEDDDYPEEYFSPIRLIDPLNHKWPEIEY